MKHQGFIPYPWRKASKSILQFWRIKSEVTHNAKGIIRSLNSILTMILKKLIRHKLSLLALLASSYFVHADTDVNADITTDTTWSKANSPYVLKDFIFVTNGATLTIEAGVTIYGEQGQTIQGQGVAPTLIITQGSKINAVGTADAPIIFTSILAKTQTLTQNDKGLWGGLIMLGYAPINGNKQGVSSDPANGDPFIHEIEGLPSSYMSTGKGTIPASYRSYGGSSTTDNSGTLKYVSIRHGGSTLGADNEINGLTCGGVGSGTSLNYIEVYANNDDGIEFFGGSVNAKYLSIAYCKDDSLDIDDGYNGKIQYVSIIQHGNDKSNCAIEWDGSSESTDIGDTKSGALPYSQPYIINLTAVGSGADSGSAKSRGMDIRDNAGGYVLNSIFTEFPNGILKVENTASSSTKGTQATNSSNKGSHALLEDGILGFFGNIFYYGDETNSSNYPNTTAGVVIESTTESEVETLVFASVNYNDADVSPELLNTDLEHGPIMPFPSSTSPAKTGAVSIADYNSDGFFDVVAYQGAFASDAPADNWLAGWTAVSNPFNVATGSSSSGGSALSNISTRGQVGTGADVMIAGIIVAQDATITIRALGPTIAAAPYNVAGAITDPVLTITDASGNVLVTNDNHGDAGSYSAPSSRTAGINAAESAVSLTLAAGNYTAIVSGAGGTTGNALVEVYYEQ